jgi:hypothetical protein
MNPKEDCEAMWLKSRTGEPFSKQNLGAYVLPRTIGHFLPGTWITQAVMRRLIGSLVHEQYIKDGTEPEEIHNR